MNDWLEGKGIEELREIRDTLGRWIDRAGSECSDSGGERLEVFITGLREVTEKLDQLIAGKKLNA